MDRVDVLEQDGQQFVRVVDYKSGAKAFRLADIVNGLNLQMFLYLFNVCATQQSLCGCACRGTVYARCPQCDDSGDESSAEKDIAGQEDKASV